MTRLNYNSASALRACLEEEGLGMRKKFGQNFLINPGTRQALADALGAAAGDEVWEVGPGLGAMTTLLLDKGCRVKAFEIDAGFNRILKSIFAGEKGFSLIEGDVMKTWEKTHNSENSAAYLLGNLPYNIAAALLADMIEKSCLYSRMVVTVQKEVALRMTAAAGSRDYSSFSVLCASAYKVRPLMVIRPSSFFPQPNVDSMGVLLAGRRGQENIDTIPSRVPSVFYPLVRSLFASRRKTIKNNAVAFFASRLAQFPAGITARELCAQFLSKNGLNGMERAEDLEPEFFISLAKSIENMRK